jgi:Helix-turn-helix domain
VAEALAKGSRITGTQRTELAAELAQRYGAGESIRAIAEATGRSFGFVHGLIKESGVEVRGRGGATRGAAAAAKGSAGPSSAAAPGTVSGPKAAAKPDKKPKAKKSDKNDDSKKSKKGKKR